ncbi:MAG TPA: hypothetical protein VGH66_01445 [Acidimicrobiales bacterium]|jgi:hypothetical protein
MALGPDSVVVNGQLVWQPDTDQYFPTAYGAQTVGVPQVSPSYPPYLGAPMASAPGASNVGGYGTASNNDKATQIAAAHPWNPRVSPTWWAVIGLVLSLMLLKAVHWRETILESGEERGMLGPFREDAGEEVR